jgi:hypothetical protein
MTAISKQRQIRRRRQQAVDNPALRIHHRQYRQPLWRYVLSGEIATVATAPLIYSMGVPFALLDAWLSFYQAVCFPAWGVARVRRRDYFAIDRHKLAYLNGLEKAHCLYCSYVNGLIAYAGEVAARTEQYWCPIRHARRTRRPHARAEAFVPYGDAAAYRASLPSLRAGLKK